MKRSLRSGKTASNLSESVHQQLNMYAIAAGAAGVGLLALAQPVEAKIVYTPTNVQISGNQYYNLDLNNDGVADFTISNISKGFGTKFGYSRRQDLLEKPATGNAAIGKPPAALSSGELISHSRLFYGGNGTMLFRRRRCHRSHCTGSTRGNWVDAQNCYLGLKFKINGKNHYGWARLTVYLDERRHLIANLTGYAYETIAGKSIIAGKTKGPDVITVQPASLGHLAQGSAGLAAWRTGK